MYRETSVLRPPVALNKAVIILRLFYHVKGSGESDLVTFSRHLRHHALIKKSNSSKGSRFIKFVDINHTRRLPPSNFYF